MFLRLSSRPGLPGLLGTRTQLLPSRSAKAMDDSLDDGLLARCRRVLSPRRMLQRGEVSGALGDLGTFLPDVVALSSVMGSALPAASFVFFSGLWNLVSGCLFDLPLPIQPMHTVVAVALTEGLTYPQLVASGLWLGAMFTLLGGSGSVERARSVSSIRSSILPPVALA